MQNDASAGIATKRFAPDSQGRLVSPWLLIQKRDLFRLPDPEFGKPAVNQDLAWPISSSFRAGTSVNSRIQAALPSSPGSLAPLGGLLRSRLLEGAKRLVRYGGFGTVLDFSSLRDRHEIKRVKGIRRIQKISTSRCHY